MVASAGQLDQIQRGVHSDQNLFQRNFRVRILKLIILGITQAKYRGSILADIKGETGIPVDSLALIWFGPVLFGHLIFREGLWLAYIELANWF